MLVWERDETLEDELNRWTDHTTVTPFEETVSVLQRALDQLSIVVQQTNESGLSEEQPVVEIELPQSTTLKLEYCRNVYATPDFSRNDARATLVSRWFGIDSPYLGLFESVPSDQNAVQKLLSAVTVAMCNLNAGSTINLPCIIAYKGRIVHSLGYLGFDPRNGGVFWESDLEDPHKSVKMEDFQRMFRLTYQRNGSITSSSSTSMTTTMTRSKKCRVSARLTWQVKFFVPESLLAGLRISAVFPLSVEGSFFENELFSTLTAEHAPMWTVLAVWNTTRPGTLRNSGKGSYDEESIPPSLIAIHKGSSMRRGRPLSLIPLSLGLKRLVRLVHENNNNKAGGDSGANHPNFVGFQDLTRKLKLSQLNVNEEAARIADLAFSNSKESNHHESPFTVLVLNVLRVLGSSSLSLDDSTDEASEESDHECKIIIQAVWHAFCDRLRRSFETRSVPALDEEDLNPDLSRSGAHQKVTLVRFCTRELMASSTVVTTGDAKKKSTKQKELDFYLSARPNQKAIEPEIRSSLVWELREDDDIDESRGELRAELSSPSLVADMRAFRLANPESVFVDFVRWFSPKDYDSKSQELSPRMSGPETQWTKAWEESAKPVESSAGGHPFDPLNRGEKALHRLETMNLSTLCE